MTGWGITFGGIARREFLRFTRQRERFLAALVRPLVWLFIFAAGFRSVLGLSITPPCRTHVLYEVCVTPGLCGMIGADRPIVMTEREGDLLVGLMARPGQVPGRGALFDTIRAPHGGSTGNVVDLCLGDLRRKLDNLAPCGLTLRTLRGRGFVLSVEGGEAARMPGAATGVAARDPVADVGGAAAGLHGGAGGTCLCLPGGERPDPDRPAQLFLPG